MLPLRAGNSQIRAILLDIEGTTTPVDFVYKTLFPYASRKLETYFREHHQDPEIQSLIAQLRAQHQVDAEAGLAPPAWATQSDEDRLHFSIDYVHWLMARDSKYNPLKTLQGKIWQQGYERGDLHGEVYADVAPAFGRWRQRGLEICIYSSGSVLAQRLLFRSTAAGDLTQFISSFFDTRTGPKHEAASYAKIADALGRDTSEILFVSDATREVEAARVAAMNALLCVRNAKDPERLSGGDFISTFDQLFPLS